MLVERGKLLSKQKNVASSFSKHSGLITDPLNLFSCPKDTLMSSGNDKVLLFTQVRKH